MLWPNRTFVSTPLHSSGLGLCPPSWRLLLAAVSRYPALAAALPHRGRSLAFLGEPSLPFGALTGGSLFSRPKERCPRRVTPSSCCPFVLPFLFHFCIQRSCGPSGGLCWRQHWTPLAVHLPGPLDGCRLHHTDPLVVFTRCVFVEDFGGPALTCW